MIVHETILSGLLLIEPQTFDDERGVFLETFHDERYRDLGIESNFVQDNLSQSRHGVIRGLHLQTTKPQGKLVSCLSGKILDVVVDLRTGSPTFGQKFSTILDSDTKIQLWIPRGFAHGFSVLSSSAICFYKCTDHYSPEDESGIFWNDPDLNIDWLVKDPIVSTKDRHLPTLRQVIG
jgi:dTDP-4-dehydrorhamnose 3,5-epimerase